MKKDFNISLKRADERKRMKTRVCILLPYFCNGGAEVMVSRLAANLDLERVDVEVVCIYGDEQNNWAEKNIISHGVKIKFLGKGKGFSLKTIQKLNREFDEFKPNVIHTHLSACVYCAPWILAHRVIMLHTIHNIPEFELIKPKRMVMSWMYKLHKAVPVAISHEIQSMMIKYYALSQKPELIYNPVDVKQFEIPPKAHNTINLITAGRLSAQKNQKMLIDAFSLVAKTRSDVRLKILGDGPLKEELRAQIITNSLENVVQLMGNVDNVADCFAESDIFVLSSDYEGLPLVVLEAMAAGLPIIATDVGGVRDIVTDNGILVESRNCDALDDAILKLINDEKLRIQMGVCSRKNVQQYDSKIIAEKYTQLYEKYSTNKEEK